MADQTERILQRLRRTILARDLAGMTKLINGWWPERADKQPDAFKVPFTVHERRKFIVRDRYMRPVVEFSGRDVAELFAREANEAPEQVRAP